MERSPVDATIVTFENVLDHGICVAEQVGLTTGACDLLFDAHRLSGSVLLAQAANVPYANGLVHGSRDDEVLLGVELSAHDVVVVTGKDGDACSALPVPDTNSLVI